jgi:hypothetical protein
VFNPVTNRCNKVDRRKKPNPFSSCAPRNDFRLNDDQAKVLDWLTYSDIKGNALAIYGLLEKAEVHKIIGLSGILLGSDRLAVYFFSSLLEMLGVSHLSYAGDLDDAKRRGR